MAGAKAIKELIPPKYSHMIGGPALKVDLHTGAIAEGVLTFSITFAVLFILLRGPRSEFMKTLLMSVSTVAMILIGSAYTGPSMNPILVSDSFFHSPFFMLSLVSSCVSVYWFS